MNLWLFAAANGYVKSNTYLTATKLPNKLSAFPCQNKFAVNVSMHAAREVGGDFYDFFMVDDDHLAVVIADVSGKGIPAALFMVITKSLIKNYAQEEHSPAEVLKVVNNQLCENNEAGMFVTAFMGILEISTSRFICINAGHVPPLLDAGDGFMRFEILPGFVLGAFEGINFPTQEKTLKPKSRLFLCTDGIGEAANERDELFTDERLCNLLNSEQVATASALRLGKKTDHPCYGSG